MSDVHPEFAEILRAALVNPRRNARRAVEALNRMDLSGAMMFLLDVRGQLDHAYEMVEAENARHVHRCSCGHTHYVHGDDA